MKIIKALETRHNGRLFRSRTEARWAVFFETLGLYYEYEKEGYQVSPGISYLPDFWLPQLDMWLEVKGGEPTREEVWKCKRLAELTCSPTMLVIGSPRPSDQIIPCFAEQCRWKVETSGERFFFSEDRRNDGEYWLTSDATDMAFSVGPAFGPNHGRHPVVHKRVERAYEAAMSARFDSSER